MAKKKRKMGNIYGIVFLIISVFLIYTCLLYTSDAADD